MKTEKYAIESLIWYNDLQDSFIKLIVQKCREKEHETFWAKTSLMYKELCKLDKDLKNKDSIKMSVWIMLVEMFGCFTVNPRDGWIERCKDCADYLESLDIW